MNGIMKIGKWAEAALLNLVTMVGFSGAGFSLWGLEFARTVGLGDFDGTRPKPHRLKPAPLKPAPLMLWALKPAPLMLW